MLLSTTVLPHLLVIALLNVGPTKVQSSALDQTEPPAEGIKVHIYEQQQQRRTTIEGVRNVTWTGETYYAFRGIPYAKAPVGELRFKDPQPLTEKPEYIDARYDGHDCPSVTAFNASEDCLIINVYTKQHSNATALPVLVFIHPGGLYVGSSRSTLLDPAYLLSHSMVLVTFNYRLGTLGFLQLGTRDIPGNAGFKDQVLALRWVQCHIRQFGGNAADVTLMGYSAGGLSVGLHLVSPMSRGLFHKAILMSGVLPAQTPLPQDAQLPLMRKQAQVLQCVAFETADDILECLQRHSGTEIAATLRQLFDFANNHPIYLWLPVIECDYGQPRFLLEHPAATLRASNFAKVPVLIGFTDGEFCRSAWDVVQNAQLERQLSEQFELLAPKAFMYDNVASTNATAAAVAAATAQLRAHYLSAHGAGGHTDGARLCDFISDAIIRYGAQRLAELAAPHTPVFSYKFTYRGARSNFNYDTKPQVARAEHMDDLMYLFRMPPHHIATKDADAAMVRVYTKFMYDFMKHGKIQAKSASTALPTFPAAYALVNFTSMSYEPGTFLAVNTYNMWRQLFP